MDPSLLNLRHVRACVAIGRLGSLNAAARAVHLTQPSLTQGLGKLELLLEVPLFDRQANGMVPNAFGRAVLPRFEAAITRIKSNRVTNTQARALLALAKFGSYAAAALALNLSEPSLHRAISDLGVALGRPMAERRGRGILLTPTGQKCARDFALAMGELEAGLWELAALKGRETGRIRIGAMPLARARVLPSAIVRFNKSYPGIRLDVIEGSYGELASLLRAGSLDFMIGALRPEGSEPDLVQDRLFDDVPIIVGRRQHPLANQERLTLNAFARYGWILPEQGTPLRDKWERLFVQFQIAPPQVDIECGSVITIRQVLLETDYLTLLSPDQVSVELEAKWLVKIAEAPPAFVRTIGVTARADWVPTRLQTKFLAALKDQT